jgi:hypothetical protein
LFHHYFYGFLVLACALAYVVFFTSVSLLDLFLINDTSIQVNVGRFFILGGATLVLDDLPDVNKRLERYLNKLKFKVGELAHIVAALQVIAGIITLYVFGSVAVAMYYVPEWVTVANFLLLGTLFITAVTSFIFVRRQVWHKIRIEIPKIGHRH